jgi:pimeloyl-ACP methyl ester carboxylesterase
MQRAQTTAMIDTIRVGDLTALRAVPARAAHEPVLFVHGYFADASIFAGWLDVFASHGTPAYALNLRGRAGSRLGTDLGRVSIDEFAIDAEVVARHLGAPAIVGHSMGGLIAQRVAERGLVRAGVLIAPAPPRGISVLSPEVALRQLEYLPAMLMGRRVRPSRRAMRALVLNHVPGSRQDAVLDRLIPDSGRAGLEMALRGVPVDAGRVQCPMLVIAADDDRFIPARIGRRIAARYRAQFDLVEHHGHMLPIEPGWEALAAIVNRWIDAHEPRRTGARRG